MLPEFPNPEEGDRPTTSYHHNGEAEDVDPSEADQAPEAPTPVFRAKGEHSEVTHPHFNEQGDRLIPVKEAPLIFNVTINIATHPEDDQLLDRELVHGLFQGFHADLDRLVGETIERYQQLKAASLRAEALSEMTAKLLEQEQEVRDRIEGS
ncbi:hypothetical protein H6G00_01610 [Leptolyngbya sp. FACHB-541]|uniref:hypothetical protein n=1 Tax=Leptolyngbya sp. FACHB-541 TaxID=2692810 RepID=UPI00168609AB|nr:hypothetical protein [Leptolyngbya sp. FACHB-541]MBD1995327.1 hypothetical protein [Leptolyngbya sp. FACHB-541]